MYYKEVQRVKYFEPQFCVFTTKYQADNKML